MANGSPTGQKYEQLLAGQVWLITDLLVPVYMELDTRSDFLLIAGAKVNKHQVVGEDSSASVYRYWKML